MHQLLNVSPPQSQRCLVWPLALVAGSATLLPSYHFKSKFERDKMGSKTPWHLTTRHQTTRYRSSNCIAHVQLVLRSVKKGKDIMSVKLLIEQEPTGHITLSINRQGWFKRL